MRWYSGVRKHDCVRVLLEADRRPKRTNEPSMHVTISYTTRACKHAHRNGYSCDGFDFWPCLVRQYSHRNFERLSFAIDSQFIQVFRLNYRKIFLATASINNSINCSRSYDIVTTDHFWTWMARVLMRNNGVAEIRWIVVKSRIELSHQTLPQCTCYAYICRSTTRHTTSSHIHIIISFRSSESADNSHKARRSSAYARYLLIMLLLSRTKYQNYWPYDS